MSAGERIGKISTGILRAFRETDLEARIDALESFRARIHDGMFSGEHLVEELDKEINLHKKRLDNLPKV